MAISAAASESHATAVLAAAISLDSRVIADGVDACIKAAREELRQGAHCIKIMGSGGVASPTDPIWMNQYREDEIRAIVNECTERRTYVSAHCHPASAVRRWVDFGVRCIEHGTLIDDETGRFVAERGAYIVPTMASFSRWSRAGPLGFPAAKPGQGRVRVQGSTIGHGYDASSRREDRLRHRPAWPTYVQQCREFTIRSEVFTPLEILRQATSTRPR